MDAQLRLQHAGGLGASADVPLRGGRLLRSAATTAAPATSAASAPAAPTTSSSPAASSPPPNTRAPAPAATRTKRRWPSSTCPKPRCGPPSAPRTIKGAVRRVGIILGGPGDRKADDGTLWLEYPSVGGVSPALNVQDRARQPAVVPPAFLAGQRQGNWVAASGAKGSDQRHREPGQAIPGRPQRKFTVRLHFMEPDGLRPGQRVFDVALQARQVVRTWTSSRTGGSAADAGQGIHGRDSGRRSWWCA